MKDWELNRIVELSVIKALIEMYGTYYVPVAASNRHIHLSRGETEVLFGKGYELRKTRELTQPGQFVCEEKLTVKTPKGSIDGVRVLGPVRAQTQVEISATDAYRLGLPECVKMSGDLAGTPGCRLHGPHGEVEIQSGVIVSARHLHISPEEAILFGLKDKDVIRVRKQGARSLVFDNVIVRAGREHSLEMHIDTDEANAAGITGRELLELEIKQGINGKEITVAEIADNVELLTEWDIKEMHKAGKKAVRLSPKGIATPLAIDAAKELGITILNLRG